MPWLDFFVPWEPSLPFIAVFVSTIWLFWRGLKYHTFTVSLIRQALFWLGMVLLYIGLHTRLDYFAQHQFFMHRIQHLGLHHLAPLLIMWSYPGTVIYAGLPHKWQKYWQRWQVSQYYRLIGHVLMNPIIVTLLFVGGVLFWLIPSIQFISMLDWRIYHLMNWSVTLTGLMYWAYVLDPRPSPPARSHPGWRVLSPIVTMMPQIIVGAYITFSQQDLYPIFDLCGRAFFLTPLFDQSLGGLIMWIPAAGFEALGALIALHHLLRLNQFDNKK